METRDEVERKFDDLAFCRFVKKGMARSHYEGMLRSALAHIHVAVQLQADPEWCCSDLRVEVARDAQRLAEYRLLGFARHRAMQVDRAIAAGERPVRFRP